VTRTVGKSPRMTVLALGALCAFAAGPLGCGGSKPAEMAEMEPGTEVDDSGALALTLQIAPTVTLASASYIITGSGGFTRPGTIDLSAARSLSAVISGLVAGSGYSIALTSTSTNGATSCAGAAIFDVAVRATTAVNVALDCHEAPRNGAITVVGSLNVCPKIDALSATPTQATVGATVALTASAHDPDAAPNPLVYKWTATSGTFDDAFARNPTFTCAVAGAATITLTVNDSDLSAGCPDAVTTQVTCTP
jgi:hypothetical protein